MSYQESKNSNTITDPDVPIIFILGVSGSGKSSFINELVPEGQEQAPIGHGVRAQTTFIREYKVIIDEKPVILVDTPGVDFSEDILADIEEWMGWNAISLRRIHSLIFLYPISRNRVKLGIMKRILDKLIGNGKGSIYRRVVLATNMWPNEVSEAVSTVHNQREGSLHKMWKPFIKQGATTMRHDGRESSAGGIIRFLLTTEAPDTGVRPQFRAISKSADGSQLPSVHQPPRPALRQSFCSLFKSYAGKVIVPVLGPTGSGKSSVWFHSQPAKKVNIGNKNLSNCTKKLGVYEMRLSSGQDLVLLDTPGYDLEGKRPEYVLRLLRQWLVTHNSTCCCFSNGANVNFSSILIFHRIADTRIPQVTRRYFRTFDPARRENGMQSRIHVVTTMWNELTDRRQGEEYEQKLKEDLWKGLPVQDSSLHQFDLTQESAKKIIDPLIKSPGYVPIPPYLAPINSSRQEDVQSSS
ncbi:hypothetical protein P691DRAFT_776263 [Macrolepiota fuliginosa MF-IS2]|uniref:G domain-containing protein n=1 Tax=Macrolepiota fuliginosa MF-IS2 TaxID=1400762 RepID=A0A9P6C396_9AGAR|nr:hypothetical protein P691DRAFT_776263 [Macrolepiota fuliginosa MF-IS2]